LGHPGKRRNRVARFRTYIAGRTDPMEGLGLFFDDPLCAASRLLGQKSANEDVGEMMKAIRVHEFGGSEVLRLEEVPTPQPGSGEVLVRMHAIGVNPVETYIRAGTYARLPALPYTPGNDGAGVVEQIGE